MSNPACSVVIRCFNEEAHIARLLEGILEQTVKDVQIIVVDSGSTDRTLEIVQGYSARVLHIDPADFSFGRALNVGCAAAKHEHIVVASAHVYPIYDTWLEHLLAPMSAAKVAVAYGKQRGNSATRFSEHQVFAQWFPGESLARQGHPFCNNANAVIRRDLWLEMPYNEELTGLEDIDWAQRAGARGLHVAYAADAEVIHAHSESLRQIFNRYEREAIALKRIMPQQRFSFWDFLRLFVANTASDYYHALRERVMLRNVVDIPSFRLMQFWGAYRGHAQHGPVTKQLRERFYYPREAVRSGLAEKGQATGRKIDYVGRITKDEVEHTK